MYFEFAGHEQNGVSAISLTHYDEHGPQISAFITLFGIRGDSQISVHDVAQNNAGVWRCLTVTLTVFGAMASCRVEGTHL